MKTSVINKQRITFESHKVIKETAEKEFCTQQVIIRQVIHDWAMKQNKKRNGKKK